MSRIEIIMPQMGESIAEGTIVRWHKKPGDTVRKDETILEISTDKVDSEIPSPAAGVLVEIVTPENTTVPVRTVIAYLETDAAAARTAAQAAPGTPAKAAAPAAPTAAKAGPAVSPVTAGPPAPAATAHAAQAPGAEGGRFYSPLVLTIARTEGIPLGDLESVPGTGEGGRLTKKDILAYVAARKSGAAPAPPAQKETVKAAPGPVTLPAADAPALRAKYPAPGHEILQMSNVMQKMAQHMVQSVQTSPHVAAVHEVDMTAVVRHRGAAAAEFEQREGFRLTFTPYIAEAVVAAIKKYPLVNSSVEGDKIIRKNFINLGIAVASESGLIVPVIRGAEEKNFIGLARAVNDLASRTRAKKLTPEDIQGGTFTITNYGVFGTMIGYPIINQPQVAILGTGALKKRPVVIDDAIAIRSMAYLTLSFDHRIIDGALAGMFLEEIVQQLQKSDRTVVH
ncbi:MAG TPA: dihydrolipoamide acetyltransferase family protein [Bacteroidota bacterium]|nr:dihydrolipoamide acetyltransferase family protein [Bacteroidota bacterium]